MKLPISISAACLFLLATSPCHAQSNVSVVILINQKPLTVNLEAAPPSVNATQMIAQLVRREVLAGRIAEAKISVPPETLASCMDLYFTASSLTSADVHAYAHRMSIVVTALKDVVTENKNPNEVYDARLRNNITRQEWTEWLATCKSTSEIEKIERLVPHSVEDMKRNSRQSLEGDLKTWLLFNQVAADFDPTREAELLSMWWTNQVAAQAIEIPHPYEKAMDLVNLLPQPNLPESVVSFLQTKHPRRKSN